MRRRAERRSEPWAGPPPQPRRLHPASPGLPARRPPGARSRCLSPLPARGPARRSACAGLLELAAVEHCSSARMPGLSFPTVPANRILSMKQWVVGDRIPPWRTVSRLPRDAQADGAAGRAGAEEASGILALALMRALHAGLDGQRATGEAMAGAGPHGCAASRVGDNIRGRAVMPAKQARKVHAGTRHPRSAGAGRPPWCCGLVLPGCMSCSTPRSACMLCCAATRNRGHQSSGVSGACWVAVCVVRASLA
jgi:hypothetical protein